MIDPDDYMARPLIEKKEGWREAIGEIPFLSFPKGWEIQVIPPFGGAMARFCVRKGEAEVSVYADFNDALGIVGQPYWETHPNTDDDCDRFLINETDELIASISKSLAWQNRRAQKVNRKTGSKT